MDEIGFHLRNTVILFDHLFFNRIEIISIDLISEVNVDLSSSLLFFEIIKIYYFWQLVKIFLIFQSSWDQLTLSGQKNISNAVAQYN